MQWAKSDDDEEAKKKSVLEKGKNIRAKLGAALHRIRFSTMSAKEFADFVGLSRNKITAMQLLNFFSSVWRTQ